jgi:RNA polymerase sporulation-specific sigma factor
VDHLKLFPLPQANLSPAETRRLLAAAQAGDTAARDKLVQANLRLARSVVQRFAHRDLDLEDLFQVACIGLVKAIDHFDLSFDVRFSTYAVPRILGEIRRHLQLDRPVKLGRAIQEKAAMVARAREEMTQELGRSPTAGEIGERLGLDRAEVVAAIEATASPVSLEEVVHEDDGAPIHLSDQLGDEGTVPALIDNLALRQAFASLAEVEKALVIMRFFRQMRQVDVARQMGVSQAYISRLEQRVLSKMRDMLA